MSEDELELRERIAQEIEAEKKRIQYNILTVGLYPKADPLVYRNGLAGLDRAASIVRRGAAA